MSFWRRSCCVEALLRVKSPCARIDLPHERCRKKDARFSLKRHGGVGSCIDVLTGQVGQCGSVSKRTLTPGRGGEAGLANLPHFVNEGYPEAGQNESLIHVPKL